MNTPFMTVFGAAVMVGALSFSATSAFAAPPNLDGTTWTTVDGGARVLFEESADGVLDGRFVWLRDEAEKGSPVLDMNNPDESLQGQPLMGTAFVSGFTRDDDIWTGGKIYDPRDGKTYASKISAGDTAETLTVAGCVRVLVQICQDQVWTRYTGAPDVSATDIATGAE